MCSSSGKEENIVITPFETSFSWLLGKNFTFSVLFSLFLDFNCKLFAYNRQKLNEN